jgi:hypothetical protein
MFFHATFLESMVELDSGKNYLGDIPQLFIAILLAEECPLTEKVNVCTDWCWKAEEGAEHTR